MDRFCSTHFRFRRGWCRHNWCHCWNDGWRRDQGNDLCRRRRDAFRGLRARCNDPVGNCRRRDRGSSGCGCRPRFEPLHLEEPFHHRESNDQNEDADDQRHEAPAASGPGVAAPSSHFYGPHRLGLGRVLQVGIAVNRHRLRGFERLQIRRYVDVQKLSVNQNRRLRVGQAVKEREIFALNRLETIGTNLRHPVGVIQTEAAREAGFL